MHNQSQLPWCNALGSVLGGYTQAVQNKNALFSLQVGVAMNTPRELVMSSDISQVLFVNTTGKCPFIPETD
jgi:hypothetical protein